MPRVLIASDDRDLSIARLQELLTDDAPSDMSEMLPSDDTKTELVEAGLQVALTSLDRVVEAVQSRVHLGVYLDAIILLTIRPYKNRTNFLYEAAAHVRGLHDAICFPNGIRAKALPIVVVDLISLLTGTVANPNDYEDLSRLGWCYVQPVGRTFGEVVSQAISTWRADLLLELDYVGYGISYNELGHIEVDHILRRKRRESVFFDDTVTPNTLHRSGYLRFHQDLLSDFVPYRKLQHVLNRVHDLPPKEQEPVLQACLDENPVLIYEDLFERHWSQLTLRHPDPLRRDIVPDFILQPKQELEQSAWQVLEIKTSEQSPMARGKFTEFFLKALEQLQLHYAEYFRNSRTASEQLQKLGHVLEKPRMALLIGRKLADEDVEVLAKATRHSEWNDVHIINYDDLFQTGVRKLEMNKTMLEGQKNLRG